MGSTWSMFFPPKPEWSVTEIPDLTGQVTTAVICEIELIRSQALLQHNAKVYIAGRTESRVTEAIKDLKAETGKTAEVIRLDLADLNSVKQAAEEFKQKETQLNWPPLDQLTSQNIDLVFGTNVLGHFYFTKLLLPTLLATAAAGNTARIIHTSSSGALFHPQKDGINYNTLLDGPARTKAGAVYLYGQSKLGNVFASNELARRYGDQGIVSISLNPGNLRTGLERHEKSQIKRKVISMLCYPVPMGALTQLWAGTTKEAAFHNGGFLQPWARIGTPPSSSTDPAACKVLWNWLEEQVARVE
ncbi:NAD-P-binding protein [Mycena maculata]|uniref:NAD-P-binding protein n=1 Tax=Mycena maculata TaxID=230809 RepID=A0AAD7IAD7_9AGAR|nr:NAD-P-binding protein [Mycena maculata]